MRFLELFDRQISFDVITMTDTVYEAVATVNDRSIRFAGTDSRRNFWIVEFVEETAKGVTHKLTGSGGEFEVFGVVKKMMDDFISKYDPKEIRFSASKKDASRAKLYASLLKRYVPKGYEYQVLDKYGTDDTNYFFIINKK